MRKKVVITGGAGFVGSQLGYKLAQDNYDVVLLDNMAFGHLDNLVIDGNFFGKLVVKDIREENLEPYFEGADTIFHLAGISALPVCQMDPNEAFSVNVAGTTNILEYARKCGARRVVFSSTSAVYENNCEKLLTEDLEVKPDLNYAVSKVHAENICNNYSHIYGMDIVICRFFNVYGPHQDFLRLSPPFTSYVTRELAFDRTPTLYNKRGDIKRDYIHVDDVLNILKEMMLSQEKFRSDIFNLTSGKDYSVPELYKIMQDVSGKNIEPSYDSPLKFWDRYEALHSGKYPINRERIEKEVFKNAHGDNKKVIETFKYTPKVDIREGLAGVYKYAINKIKANHKEL